jgi:hypothetical protein
MEDAPSLQSWLLVHLVLDLPVDFSGAALNVERVPLPTALGAHDHVAGLVLESLQRRGILLELQVPEFLLFLTLGIGLENLEEVLALANLPVRVRVDDLSQVLHQAEVSSHRVSQASHLAKLRDEGNLNASLSVLVD